MNQFKQHHKPDSTLFEDDNRIDWERRKLRKKNQEGLMDEDILFELDDMQVETAHIQPRKKGKRTRRQQFIMDEEVGVVVKRRRKDSRHYDEWDDYG